MREGGLDLMSRALAIAVSLAVMVAVPALAQYDEAPEPLTAAPSVLGPTGAVLTPTTEMPAANSYAVGFHWLNDTLDAVMDEADDIANANLTWRDRDEQYQEVLTKLGLESGDGD